MKTTELQKLKEECAACGLCPLSATRTNIVFGKGNENAELLFIGEAPGEKEDLSGLPFVGAAGKLLNQFLQYIDLSPDDIYITNILKCRPPKNRDPSPEETEVCIGYLRRQLSLIDPKIIVCLGRISAMRIIKPDFKITAEHGKWFRKGRYLITAVYHPAALLRDPRKKEEMLEDFKSIEKMRKSMASGNN